MKSARRRTKVRLLPRRLRIEPLENRRVLASLGGEASFLLPSGGSSDPELFDVGGSISGSKFDDLNGNGTRDGGEPGIANVTIGLVRNGDLSGITYIQTDADGNYVFTDLAEGIYSLREVVPPGSVQTTPLGSYDAVIVDGANPNPTGIDFGNFTLVTLAGTAFHDLNGNGVRDAGEEGIDNVLIHLDLGSDGSIDHSLLTASDGTYEFTEVGPGQHSITETLPSGFVQTFPASGAGHVITTASGTPVAGLDFGNQQPPPMTTSVSGFKFNDLNGDGVRQAGEPGLAGVTIQLNVNNDGSDIRSVTTAADGRFIFTNVPAGMHSVAEMLPLNTVQTTPGGLGIFRIDANPPVATDGLLFGNFMTTTLSGFVFQDENENCVWDEDDSVMEGVVVQLDLDSNGSIDLSVLTDASGHYEFTDVGPGTHRITEVLPPGFRSPSTPPSHTIANRSGEDAGELNFLNCPQGPLEASIHGFVYTDNDFDGVFDAHEIGLPNVTITLTSADNSLTRTTKTGPDGAYSFVDLPAGTYHLTQSQPANFGDASISLGRILPIGRSSGSADGLNIFRGVVLGSNETAIDYNFGEVLTAVTKRMFRASTDVRAELWRSIGAIGSPISGAAAIAAVDDALQFTGDWT